jgi:endoglucanase
MKKPLYLMLLLVFSSISLVAQPPQIAVNQSGYYPKAPKQAIVASVPRATRFGIISEKGDTVFRGQLSPVRKSKNSVLTTRVADFSAFTQTGKFRVVSGGIASPVFSIAEHVQTEAAKSVIKAYY